MKPLRSPAVLLALAALIALGGLLVYGVLQEQGDSSIETAIAAGDRKLATVREVPVLFSDRRDSLERYRGDVVVLNFWASWCDPCRKESPALERIHRKYKGKGVTVIGADVDDLTGDARKFINEYELSYRMLRYTSNNAAKDFGTRALPETFVIDPRGRIAAVRRGPVSQAALETMIKAVLDDSPAGDSPAANPR